MANMRRTTLHDVAKLAGVGKVTVSYVLNGRSREARISIDTEQRVLEAARTLDYRPNALARMLLRKRSDSLCVVFQYASIFNANTAFVNELMRGVCQGCTETDVDLMLHTKPFEDPQEEADKLTDGRLDGVLMLRDSDDPCLKILVSRRFPVVLFFTRPASDGIPYVDCDNYQGGRIATQHLLELGHRRIGMLTGSPKSMASQDRFNGYRDALERSGLPVDPGLQIQMGPNTDASEFVAFLTSPKRPTALFAWSDDVAFYCMRIMKSIGLRVPEDISLIGFDSCAVCDSSTPPLTSIRQPIYDMARSAAHVLRSIVCGQSVENRIIFPLDLEVRKSTAPLR